VKGSIRAPRTPGGTWAYRIDSGMGRDGRRGQRQVAGFASREEAETALAEALAAQGGGDAKTVAGFLERVWLPAKRMEVERSTFDQYVWAVRRHIVPELGSVKLADLEPDVLQAWLARLLRPVPGSGKAPLGSRSARLVRKVLSMGCEDAVERGVLGENPLRLTKAPELAEVRRPAWTGEESRRFFAAAAAHRLGVAFHLALATGLRRGELLALRWSDVDVDRRRLWINRQLVVEAGRPRLKTLDPGRGQRAVPLTSDMVRMLAGHRRQQDAERASAGERWSDGDLVFATPRGGMVAPERFAAVMDDLITTAGVGRITPEGLRRMAPDRSAM
jgi:integrase